MPPTRQDWPRLLGELAVQLQSGRVYDRDLDDLAIGLAAVDAELTRRTTIRSRTRPRLQ